MRGREGGRVGGPCGGPFHDNSILNATTGATTGEILRKVEFNRNGTTVECNQKVTYNKKTNMIEFTIPLGDCNMITTASSKFDSRVKIPKMFIF